MYSHFNRLLSDKTGGEVFTCFGLAHWCYIVFMVATIALFLYLTRNKDRDYRRKKISIFANIGFGLYMADFFLMPFAYGYIDIDKLPFHACTSMAIMCFLGEHTEFFKKYRIHFALLAFLSNFAYICYPSGVMSYEIHPLSYRAVQTLLFHSVMTVYAFLTFVNDAEEFKYKTWYRNLVVLGSLTAWAIIGNTLYSGEAGEYSHYFNWFFVIQDPFYILPESIGKYILPFINIIAFFAVEMLIYFIINSALKVSKKQKTAVAV